MNASILFIQWRVLGLVLLGSLLVSILLLIRAPPDSLAYGVLRGVGDSPFLSLDAEKSNSENQVRFGVKLD